MSGTDVSLASNAILSFDVPGPITVANFSTFGTNEIDDAYFLKEPDNNLTHKNNKVVEVATEKHKTGPVIIIDKYANKTDN